MKRMAILLPLITLLVISFSGGVAAKQKHCRGGHGPESSCTANGKHRMFDKLQLNEKQQNELKSLHDEMMGVRKKHHEAIKAVRDNMKKELLKKEPSQKSLNGYAAELGKLHTTMTKDRTDHLLKVKKILTAEQFSKLVEKEGKRGRGGPDHMRPGKCPRKGDCPHKQDCPRGKKGDRKGCCSGKGLKNTPPPADNTEKAE